MLYLQIKQLGKICCSWKHKMTENSRYSSPSFPVINIQLQSDFICNFPLVIFSVLPWSRVLNWVILLLCFCLLLLPVFWPFVKFWSCMFFFFLIVGQITIWLWHCKIMQSLNCAKCIHFKQQFCQLSLEGENLYFLPC